MIQFSPKDPTMRLRKITEQWRHLGYSQSEYLANAGVKVDPNPVTIKGFQLPQPDLLFGPNEDGIKRQDFRNYILKPNRERVSTGVIFIYLGLNCYTAWSVGRQRPELRHSSACQEVFRC